jgi:hypothetical protein
MKPIIVILICISFCSCTKKGTMAFAEGKSKCMGVELDGSQTLQAYGKGRNRRDAVHQAEKNAVRDVVFNGICDGKGCECRPVIGGVNDNLMRSPYFNDFFKDQGEFKDYVDHSDERLGRRIFRPVYRASSGVAVNAIVTVDRSALIEKLKKDEIIK